MPKLSELGERFLIKYVLDNVDLPREAVPPAGDDAVAIWFSGLLLASVDMLVWETDVPPGMNHRQVGWKAAVSSISDIAAKGGRPKYLLLSLGLNPEMEFEDFRQLFEGIKDAAKKYGAKIVGGDLNELRTTSVSITAIGSAQQLMSRRGAKPGDILATTGFFGKTYVGLHALLNNNTVEEEILKAVYFPEPRVEEGIALASSGGVSACIDSSDGLAESLHILGETNDIGFAVDFLPADSLAERYCRDKGLDVFDAVFFGGEEYELVFTIKGGWEAVVESALKKVGGRMVKIGRVTTDREIVYLAEGKRVEIPRKGWQHFHRRQ
ncbi:MAG: thiamine-phosphate kinase [Candidatus Caldarchaeum sp.]|nr:thiamine-phosphate kinase [Candidatus Caldarchaeum sp.]